jgi:hypothetical protein
VLPDCDGKRFRVIQSTRPDQITNDPGILGLGDDLEIAGREHRQPVGGRIDFLMRDAEGGTYYEVEDMLISPEARA